MPDAMHILRDELPNIDITVSSQTSPELAEGLMRGKLDLAFLRPEPEMPAPGIQGRYAGADRRGDAERSSIGGAPSIAIQEVAAETFLGMSKTAPVVAG